jgi:hypothetical protein
MLIKVRITRISSFKSPDGRTGRQIEFTEEQRIRQPVFASSEADQAQMAGDISALMGPLLKGFQGMFPIVMPRMSIWLLEEEIEELGIPLEVNKTYNMDVAGGIISLKPTEKEE